MEKKFIPTEMGNELLKVSKNCCVSFNECVNGIGLGFEADNNSPETAIVIKIKGETIFKILNGDFRNECLNKNMKELLKLYSENKDKHSSWSNR